MVVRRLARDDQPRGDVGVAQPVDEQSQHVELAVGQPSRGWPAWPVSCRAAPTPRARATVPAPGPRRRGRPARPGAAGRPEDRRPSRVPQGERALVGLLDHRRRGGCGSVDMLHAGRGEPASHRRNWSPLGPGRSTGTAASSSRGSGRRVIHACSASAAAAGARRPGRSSLVASRHSSSRCGFSGGRRPPGGEQTEHEVRPQAAQRDVPGCEHRQRVLLGFPPAALEQPQPGLDPALPHAADRDVAFLAEAQGVGQDVVGLREPAVLDVVMGEVAHRDGHELVDPQPQPGVPRREQVGPRRPGRRRSAGPAPGRSSRRCAGRRRPARRRSAARHGPPAGPSPRHPGHAAR